MVDEKYYFDTYALIEIYKNNPNYEKFKKTKMILHRMNIFEFVYTLIKDGHSLGFIKNVINSLKQFEIEGDDKDLIQASQMKLRYKKERLSYVDCLGYVLAKKEGARFLTGDEKFGDPKFEKKDNVEYVK